MKERLFTNLEFIAADNQSGSTGILRRVQEALSAELRSGMLPDENTLIEFCRLVLKQFPDFPVVHHFLNEFCLAYENLTPKKDSDDHLINAVKTYQNHWQGAVDSITEQFFEIDPFPTSILFHSNSTVLHALGRKLSKMRPHFPVYQTISRPAGEGKIQAGVFYDAGLDVTVLEDMNAATCLNSVSAIVTGADLIDETRFKNKIGTYFQAVAAREFEIPVYVLSDRRKSFMSAYPSHLKDRLTEESLKPAEEIWGEAAPCGMKVLNRYFEWIPNNLVSGFITEAGIETPQAPSNTSWRLSSIFGSAVQSMTR